MSARFEAEGRDEAGQDDPLLVEWAAELAVRIRDGEAVDWEEISPAGIPSGPRRSTGCSRPSP